jgi:cellulose synthase/poly-beta-1,6-N-acetylglucosamine synthase-like glycosyltransferase
MGKTGIRIMVQILLSLWLAFLALEVMLYWIMLGSSGRAAKSNLPDVGAEGESVFYLVSACRDGAALLPSLIKNWRSLNYPSAQRREMIVADNCSDETAAAARQFGVEVYERQALQNVGKGNAISEALSEYLQHQAFDALVVLDVDARVQPSFLRQAASYFARGADVLVFATYAKNPDETLLARVGDIIQGFLRLNQSGRAARGLHPILYGSHGYALSRSALNRLGWRTTTGQAAEDMELGLRSGLADLRVRYAPDIAVYNDVTAAPTDVRAQRTRWNAIYPPLIAQYVIPLLKRALLGRCQAWDGLFGELLLPSFANLFIFLFLTTLILGSLSKPYVFLRPYAAVSGGLWILDIVYFLTGLAKLRIRLGWAEWKGFAAHIVLRSWALVEGLWYVGVKDWAPAPHPPDKPHD